MFFDIYYIHDYFVEPLVGFSYWRFGDQTSLIFLGRLGKPSRVVPWMAPPELCRASLAAQILSVGGGSRDWQQCERVGRVHIDAAHK